ncbi:MAG TPA: hypothetical protein VGG29_02390 [Caulobacteraceae bacterium]|jgi:hypothetical protein
MSAPKPPTQVHRTKVFNGRHARLANLDNVAEILGALDEEADIQKFGLKSSAARVAPGSGPVKDGPKGRRGRGPRPGRDL